MLEMIWVRLPIRMPFELFRLGLSIIACSLALIGTACVLGALADSPLPSWGCR